MYIYIYVYIHSLSLSLLAFVQMRHVAGTSHLINWIPKADILNWTSQICQAAVGLRSGARPNFTANPQQAFSPQHGALSDIIFLCLKHRVGKHTRVRFS